MSNITEAEVETIWLQGQRLRRASRFLKGPVPLAVLQQAARRPGKSLALYLAIRHRIDLRGMPEVSLPAEYLATWGISKYSKLRAIAALERAGLVRVVGRGPGRSMRVALVEDYEAPDSNMRPAE
jgi:hypothetical protein